MNKVFSVRTRISELLRIAIGRQYNKLNLLYNFCSWKYEILDNLDSVKIFDFYPYEKREVLYAWLNNEELKNKPIDFLEFGSWKGESMGKWCSINKNPESRFFGFDSFQGLQESYDGLSIGHCDVGGEVPRINDIRVSFIKGFFTNTLPEFLKSFEPRNRLVIHMDADLYSSTLFVLIHLNKLIDCETIIIFDEFAQIEHEFPAFREYLRVCGKKFKIIAARSDIGKIAVKIL